MDYRIEYRFHYSMRTNAWYNAAIQYQSSPYLYYLYYQTHIPW
jgi:hypothetical protein